MNEKVLVWVDGGAINNPGPSAIGVVIKIKKKIKTYAQKIGLATNNQAEYQAIIFALKKLKQLLGKKRKTAQIIIHSDSELISKQLNGECKITDSELQKLFLQAWNLKLDFPHLKIKLISRKENKLADQLVKQILQK